MKRQGACALKWSVRRSRKCHLTCDRELIYPNQSRPLRLAILPAYGMCRPDPVGWLPAVIDGEESDFYCTVRAAKFVGHGNRRAKVSFLSPRTFDLDSDDPYEAFYDYCSRSDKWSYHTKDRRGRHISGEVEGAIFPRMKNFFVANVMDVSAGSRGGVFVTELSESAMKGILYSVRKDGRRVDGIAFAKDRDGKPVYGDITDPGGALVIEIAYGGEGYAARPVVDGRGGVVRVEIPSVLLQHRHHMEEPGTFMVKPESEQEIVDRLAGMLRGYRSEDGTDEIESLKEAMKLAYGDKYRVPEGAMEQTARIVGDDPFGDAAKKTVAEDREKKAEEVSASVDRGIEREKYTPATEGHGPAPKKKPNVKKAQEKEPENDPFAPGENIDPSDIASVRAMLSGGN